WIQMLIQSSRAEGIPRIQFCRNCKVCKPVQLDCLPVCLRLVCRYNFQVCSNLKQLCLSCLVFFFFCHFKSKFVITLSKNNDSIARDVHRFQLFCFIQSFRIIDIIQSIHCLFDFLFIIHVSGCEYLLASACMSRSSLLHELCEHTCFIAVMPFRCHLGKMLFSHASSCPVRDDLFSLKLPLFFCCLEGYQISFAHDDHILFTVAAKFRECRRCLRIFSFFTNDQFAVSKI